MSFFHIKTSVMHNLHTNFDIIFYLTKSVFRKTFVMENPLSR